MTWKGWCLKKNGESSIFENKGEAEDPLVRGSRHGGFPGKRALSCQTHTLTQPRQTTHPFAGGVALLEGGKSIQKQKGWGGRGKLIRVESRNTLACPLKAFTCALQCFKPSYHHVSFSWPCWSDQWKKWTALKRLGAMPVLLNQWRGKMDVHSAVEDQTESNWKTLRGLVTSKKSLHTGRTFSLSTQRKI